MSPCATNNEVVSAKPGTSTSLLYVSRRVVWGGVGIAVILSLPALISGLASPVLIPLLLAVLCTVVAFEFALRVRSTWEKMPTGPSETVVSGFVVDGYERTIDGIEAEVRPKIETKYASEWNASGFIKRWFLRRYINREIAERVAELSKHISPNSLF